MTKTLVLHIGANKTGSSAIQKFLRINARALSKFGIVVAPADMRSGGRITGEHVWFVQSLSDDFQQGRTILADRLDDVMENVPEGGKLLVSAENVSSQVNRSQFFRDTPEKYEVQIILYIRRQDELLMSSWQQWYSKITD